MTHFLWVEDFNVSEDKRSENIVSSTVSSVFGSILNNAELSARLAEEDENDAQDFLEEKGIFLKLDLLEALEFINDPKELSKIDFVVLDVDMPLENGQRDNNNYLPILIEQYKSEDALRKIAGYQIYTELVIELGFPKSHILFCSNHASYFEELKSKFASANIKPPVSPNPNEPFLRKEDKEFINQWLDNAHVDYFVLRRGIIEGCRYIANLIKNEEKDDVKYKDKEKQLTKDYLRFNDYIESEKEVSLEDMRDYLKVLENFLPLRKPVDKSTLYKLFIRTLTHEWEATEPKRIRGLAWIMKSTRNWITHNSTLFNAVDEQIIAYLFMINMRIMFNFGEAKQTYEEMLFKLFSGEDLTKEIFEEQNKNKLITLKIKKAYCDLQNKVANEKIIKDAFRFSALANNIQESNSELRKDKVLFDKVLYQLFWLSNSYPRIEVRMGKVEITFEEFDYRKKAPYLFELARHIYNRSFS